MPSFALPLAPGSTGARPPLDDGEAARVARALAHPARLRILRILGREDECYCGDLCQELGLAQSTTSQHLKVLREAGLVRATPCGTAVGYRAEPVLVGAFMRWTGTLLPAHDPLSPEAPPSPSAPSSGSAPGGEAA